MPKITLTQMNNIWNWHFQLKQRQSAIHLSYVKCNKHPVLCLLCYNDCNPQSL